MIKITFLKKDELAKKIYKTIWKNRNTRYISKNPHHFNRFIFNARNELFVYEGNLYIVYGNNVLINLPEHNPVFTEDEINSTVVIEEVDFQRKKGQGKFLTEENLERRFDLIEAKNPFYEGCEMNPLAKLMAMHKTIMAELEDAIEKSKNINNDENNTGRM